MLVVAVGGFIIWKHGELGKEIRVSVADTLESAASVVLGKPTVPTPSAVVAAFESSPPGSYLFTGTATDIFAPHATSPAPPVAAVALAAANGVAPPGAADAAAPTTAAVSKSPRK